MANAFVERLRYVAELPGVRRLLLNDGVTVGQLLTRAADELDRITPAANERRMQELERVGDTQTKLIK